MSEDYDAGLWHRKVLKMLPMLAGAGTLLVGYGIGYYLNIGESYLWLVFLLAPVPVWLGLNQKLTREYDWFPYHEDDLVELDRNCPNCGSDEYYAEGVVYRCLDCRAEGIGPL